MNTTIRIRANELNEQVLEGIKKLFGQQEINIVISPVHGDDTLADLEPRMEQVNEEAGKYTFSGQDFEELTNRLLEDRPVEDLLEKASKER